MSYNQYRRTCKVKNCEIKVRLSSMDIGNTMLLKIIGEQLDFHQRLCFYWHSWEMNFLLSGRPLQQCLCSDGVAWLWTVNRDMFWQPCISSCFPCTCCTSDSSSFPAGLAHCAVLPPSCTSYSLWLLDCSAWTHHNEVVQPIWWAKSFPDFEKSTHLKRALMAWV